MSMIISWNGPAASGKDNMRVLETGCVGTRGGFLKMSFEWGESKGFRLQWRLEMTLIISSQSRKITRNGKAASWGNSSSRYGRGREDCLVQTYEEVKWVCGFPSPAVFNDRKSEPEQNCEMKPSSSPSTEGRGGVETWPRWCHCPCPHPPLPYILVGHGGQPPHTETER